MVREQHEVRLDEFIIEGAKLLRNGVEIACFKTPIAEIARLNDHIFVVLAVPEPTRDPVYAGTNLWAIGLDGRVLWTAPNVNEGLAYNRNLPASYSNLRIFDKTDPKIICYVADRREVMLQAAIGKYVTNIKPIPMEKWKSSYQDAMREHDERVRHTEEATFVESLRIAKVSTDSPLISRSNHPASVRLSL